MLDHMTFRVTDIARAKAFYSAALAPLHYSVSFEGRYGSNILGFAYPDASEPDGKKADVWFIDGPSPHGGPAATVGCHLAWRADTRAQVDAFYRAALAAGGKDTACRACARITTLTTTARSSSTPRATTSKRCAIGQSRRQQNRSDAWLPSSIVQAMQQSRTAPEAARRLIALACVGAASNDLALREEILSWLADEGIDASLSPKERGFLNDPDPSGQDIINFSWSSEAMAIIGWALGLRDERPPPLAPSSVGDILDQLPAPGEAVTPFIDGATLRSRDELNDCAAKLFDIHAWCRSAADRGQPERHGYDLEVAQEQHRAINWLVRHEGSEWDDVATDT